MSTVSPRVGLSMSVATAGSPLSFFIIARDKGSSMVHQAFDGVLPWRVSGDVYVSVIK
jgi:hypothetical protein